MEMLAASSSRPHRTLVLPFGPRLAPCNISSLPFVSGEQSSPRALERAQPATRALFMNTHKTQSDASDAKHARARAHHNRVHARALQTKLCRCRRK